MNQNPAGFIIRRGTNISHWLSQDFGWAPHDQWFTEADVRSVANRQTGTTRYPRASTSIRSVARGPD